MFTSAIVAAAGLGVRLKCSVPKPLVRLNKKPIFIYTLNALARHPDIKEIILVVSSKSLDSTKRYLKKYRIKKIKELVIGGKQRCDSIRNGLSRISPQAELVLIHDAVRPFIEKCLISRLIRTAKRTGAAIPGLPVKPTIKEVNAKGRVVGTLKRERLYEIQTPQVFKSKLISAAYKKFPRIAAVDDACLVEKLKAKVAVVPGSYFNLKITTPEDLVFAQAILNK